MVKNVRLRFAVSKRDNELISFVAENVDGLEYVSETSKARKSIVLPGKEIKKALVSGSEYDCDLIPMKNGARGFVCVSCSPVQYKATVETIYVKKCLYQVKVNFNNHTIMFDPFEGNSVSSNHSAVLARLTKRVDFENHKEILADFLVESKKILKHLRADGMDMVRLMRKQ